MTEHGDLLTKQPINVAGDVSDDTISLLRVQVIRGVACVDNLVNVISSARRENLEIKKLSCSVWIHGLYFASSCWLWVGRYCKLRQTYLREFKLRLAMSMSVDKLATIYDSQSDPQVYCSMQSSKKPQILFWPSPENLAKQREWTYRWIRYHTASQDSGDHKRLVKTLDIQTSKRK